MRRKMSINTSSNIFSLHPMDDLCVFCTCWSLFLEFPSLVFCYELALSLQDPVCTPEIPPQMLPTPVVPPGDSLLAAVFTPAVLC